MDPVTIDVDRDDAVTITWEDGHVSRFPIELLRANCMCAQCRGLRDRGRPAWARSGDAGTLEVVSARQVGNWGLNLHWNDGHTTGIFTWEVLRAWCLCEVLWELRSFTGKVRRRWRGLGAWRRTLRRPCRHR